MGPSCLWYKERRAISKTSKDLNIMGNRKLLISLVQKFETIARLAILEGTIRRKRNRKKNDFDDEFEKS